MGTLGVPGRGDAGAKVLRQGGTEPFQELELSLVGSGESGAEGGLF